jgi:hypothetical protein
MTSWGFYLFGAFLALVWKYASWVYIGVVRNKQRFGTSSRAWFEFVTIDARVSWLATIAGVWVIGTIYIKQIGISWLFGGVLAGLPVIDSFCFFLGIIAEYIAPALLKWLASKIPWMKIPE